MITYKIRNGYGDDARPLVEFASKDTALFKTNLSALLRSIGAILIGQSDLWQNDEFIETFEYLGKQFEVSYSSWGLQFIQEIGQSDIIDDIRKALNESKNFTQI